MSGAVKLDSEIAERLDQYTKKTGVRKKYLASKAVEKELDQREQRLQGDTNSDD